jgi:hypothetical protein
MRDTAIGGLAALLVRADWRASKHGGAIASLVEAALRHENPVVRMRAAEGVLALHADDKADVRAAAVGELLLAEQDSAVRAMLLNALVSTAADAPATVDGVLERVLADEDMDADDEDLRRDSLTDLLTFLAIVPKTPFAYATVEAWCQDASARPSAVRFAASARDYLEPPASEAQKRAFSLLQTAAQTAAARWSRDQSEHLASAELTPSQRAELEGAVKVCHEIAQQIYFASGAYEAKSEPSAEDSAPDAAFADLAMPVLRTCASTGVPQCVHSVVETMIFLAPLDEAGTLAVVAEVVPRDGSYAGEPLAGDEVIPYLERLLAGNRPLVLFDRDGAEAFRRLLATFAAAGNQEALALAYTFADVFR